MSSRNQSYLIYLLLLVAIISMVVYSFGQRANATEVSINQLAADIKENKVTKIETDDDHLTITYKDLKEAVSIKEPNATLVDQLLALGVTQEQLDPSKIKILIKAPSTWVGVFSALGYILPFLLLIGAFFFIFRQAQGSNNAAMSFGKSRARMFTGDHPTVTFADVAAWKKPRKSSKRWWNSCANRRNSSNWEHGFRKASCWWVLPVPARL